MIKYEQVIEDLLLCQEPSDVLSDGWVRGEVEHAGFVYTWQMWKC